MKNYLILLLLLISSLSFSQTNNQNETLKYSHKLTLGSDLFQPSFLGGFNLNVTYTTNRFVFDYSHGVALDIGENFQNSEQKALNAKIVLPWTTGPGVGYRFSSNFDARVDFKVHSVEVDLLNGQQQLEYQEYTMGPGAFYRFYFGKNTGFGIETSVRYWFDLGNNIDTLVNDKVQFEDTNGITQVFDPSVSSGFGINVALIYTFGKNK